MKYEVLFEIPRQTIVVEADNEMEAEEKLSTVLDGITLEITSRYEDIHVLGIREVN